MKKLIITAIVVLSGCVHVLKPIPVPRFDKLENILYIRHENITTPTGNHTEEFHIQIWIHPQEIPHIAYAMTSTKTFSISGTNQTQTYDLEQFNCEVPTAVLQQLYETLTAGPLKTLPGKPGPEGNPFARLLFSSRNDRGMSQSSFWFLNAPPTPREWLILHKELVSFIRARIQEHPENLQIEKNCTYSKDKRWEI